MIKGPLKFLALLALAVGALFAVPAIASAHVPFVTPGAFCAKDLHYEFGQAENGNWYQCLPPKKGDGPWHWEGSSSPTPTDSGSTGAPATLPGTSTPAPSSSTGALPVTGAKEDVIAGVGAGAVALGGVGLWFGLRRRRVRFQA